VRLSVEEETGLWGKVVRSLDGASLGRVDELFYDEATTSLKWLVIKRGVVMSRRFLIPAAGLELEGEIIRTAFTRIEVEDEPQFDWPGGLSPDAEATLVEYFYLPEEDREHPIQVIRQGDAHKGRF